jgi:DNA excision repair protein ERCC-2
MISSRLNEEIKPYFPYKKIRRKQGAAINIIHNKLINSKNHVVVSAPNGFGKTILSLAALLPIIKGKNKKLVYLVRTHKQGSRVMDELQKIDANIKKLGLSIDIGGFGLRGRHSMCFHPAVLNLKDPSSAHLTCSELRKTNRCLFYNNINRKTERVDFLLSILKISPMDGSNLIDTCKDYDLCPYQISKLALNQVDVIACNYQWILNPFIRNGFLETLNTSLEDIILVIDEAHNLPDIATEIASSQITLFTVKLFIEEVRDYRKTQYLQFGKKLLEILEDLLKNDFDELKIIPEYIVKKLQLSCNMKEKYFEKMIEIGKDIRKLKLMKGKKPQSSIYSLGLFWLMWLNAMKKDSYFFLATKYQTQKGYETIKLEIISLDPRDLLTDIFSEVEGSLHMSGTITPDAYIDTMGLPDSTAKLNLPSLWKDENLKVLAIKGITSKGTSRSLGMYKLMLEHIKMAIRFTPKNIGIFAASYEILNGLLKAGFKKIKTNKKMYMETPGLTSIENDKMIHNYKYESKKNGGILLGVCGGRNAEGEDFPGDYMNTVVICGLPFARPTVRIQAVIDYYVKLWGNEKGRDIAYNIPALRRANQAAGRPIRTLEDKGIIILLDYRYASNYFNKYLANWLREKIKVIDNNPDDLKKELLLFYGSK